MPYWQLFYHFVWSTKLREPLITGEREAEIYGLLRGKAVGLGATVFALNGTVDHLHLVASVPPSLAVAMFIGQVKGVTATRINQAHGPGSLFWQAEYGVFSFDGKRLARYVAYVEAQKSHHACNTTIPLLERVTDGSVHLVREAGTVYEINNDDALAELF